MLTYICYKYEGCAVQHQIYGIDGGKYLPVFSHSAVFCIGLSNAEMEGRKKYNALIQHLYYCNLICMQVERCMLPLMWCPWVAAGSRRLHSTQALHQAHSSSLLEIVVLNLSHMKMKHISGWFFWLHLLSMKREQKLQSINSPCISEIPNLRQAEPPP